MIGYAQGSVSATSYTVLVGVTWLVFAYLGGISSISGALVAGTFAPLGITFVIVDRWIGASNGTYQLIAAIGLIMTTIFNPEGIAGAMHERLEAVRARRKPKVDGRGRRRHKPGRDAGGSSQHHGHLGPTSSAAATPTRARRHEDPALDSRCDGALRHGRRREPGEHRRRQRSHRRSDRRERRGQDDAHRRRQRLRALHRARHDGGRTARRLPRLPSVTSRALAYVAVTRAVPGPHGPREPRGRVGPSLVRQFDARPRAPVTGRVLDATPRTRWRSSACSRSATSIPTSSPSASRSS